MPQHAIWLPQARIQEIDAGHTLLIGLLEPGSIHWGIDGWQSPRDAATKDTGLGVYVAEIDTASLRPGQRIDFTYQRTDTGEWSGSNYTLTVNRKDQGY